MRANLADALENLDMASIDGTRGVEVRRVLCYDRYDMPSWHVLCRLCYLTTTHTPFSFYWDEGEIVHPQMPGEVPCCENVIRGCCLSERFFSPPAHNED